MLSKNVISPRDTVRVVPFGKLICLEYNTKGILSKVSNIKIISYEVEVYEELDRSFVNPLQKRGVIPSRLNNVLRPCKIYGVIHSDNLKMYPYGENVLYGFDDDIDFMVNRNEFDGMSFIAFDVVEGPNIPDAYQRSARLQQFGFKICNSFITSNNESKDFLESNLVRHGYPFVSGYYISSTGRNVFICSDVYCYKVAEVTQTVTCDGYIDGAVKFDPEELFDRLFPYTSIVKFNVQPGSLIYVDDNKIIYSSTKGSGKQVDRNIRCEYCGKEIRVPNNGYVRCYDSNCVSNLYPTIERMLRRFNMNEMDWVDFVSYAHKRQLTMLSDIFDMDEYKNVEVECTLSELLDAICPMEVRRIPDFFDRFVEYAGSFEAVDHYIQNPEDMLKDMDFDRMSLSNVSKWFEVPQNVLLINTMLDTKNIHIVNDKPVLNNVAPIFRNKNIFLEGSFKHGNYNYIVSIMKSYGANVTTTFDNRCDCVVLGHFTDPDKDEIVAKANAYRIPVYEELTFFSSYEIDKDLRNTQ